MPLVRISMIEGRTADQKQEAAAAITEILANTCQTPPESVIVIFDNIPDTDWTIGGVTVRERQRLREKAGS